MDEQEKEFQEVVEFHGHACPGLAFGFRATKLALRELGISRSSDEELVAVVENNSSPLAEWIDTCSASRAETFSFVVTLPETTETTGL